MYSPKLIIGSLLGAVPFGGGIPLLLSTISSTNKLNETSPHWNKLIEVKFYGKDNKDTSIKVWIEDLENINKAEYLDNDTWKPIGNSKKYKYLAELAKYYLLTQHRINVASSFHLLSKDNHEIKDLQCTQCPTTQCVAKSELECFLKCCKDQVPCTQEDIKQDQKTFAAYLSNLYSAWNSTYFQPIQAHIYLGDNVDLNNNNNVEPKPTKLVGATIYGFTDYQYREKKDPDTSDYKKLLKLENQTINNNNKYFINYPQTFNLQESDNKLKKIFEESKKNSNLVKKAETQQNQSSCDNLQCLIAKNYVKSFSSLDQSFKDIVNCKSS